MVKDYNVIANHSMAVRKLIKVWKMETGPLQGDRASSKGPFVNYVSTLGYLVGWPNANQC